MRRGELWWGSLADPVGSGPGFRRPLLIVQSNEFNSSKIQTAVCAAITSNLHRAAAPGNVLLSRKASGLPRDSVVNVSQLLTVDKTRLGPRIGRVPAETLREVDDGIRLVLAL